LITREETLHMINSLNDGQLRFVNIDGTGYPVDRITSYDEEDSEGKSVVVINSLQDYFQNSYPVSGGDITLTGGTAGTITYNTSTSGPATTSGTITVDDVQTSYDEAMKSVYP
jgi:hypothetical protein